MVVVSITGLWCLLFDFNYVTVVDFNYKYGPLG